MEAGYRVINDFFIGNENCILVDNFLGLNQIVNRPINIKNINSFKDKYAVGMWKIKKINN